MSHDPHCAAAIGLRVGRLLVIKKHSGAGYSLVAAASTIARLCSRRQVREMVRELVLHPLCGVVFQPVFQDSARDTRVLVIQRDERVEAGNPDCKRHSLICELHNTEWIFSFENTMSETRQTFMP